MSSRLLDWSKIDEGELQDFLYENGFEYHFVGEELYDKVNSVYKLTFDPDNDLTLMLTDNIEDLIIKSPTFYKLNKDVFSVMMINKTYDEIINFCNINMDANKLCQDETFWKLYLIKRYGILPQMSIEDLKYLSRISSAAGSLEKDITDRYSVIFKDFQSYLFKPSVKTVLLFMKSVYEVDDESSQLSIIENKTSILSNVMNPILNSFAYSYKKNIYQASAYDYLSDSIDYILEDENLPMIKIGVGLISKIIGIPDVYIQHIIDYSRLVTPSIDDIIVEYMLSNTDLDFIELLNGFVEYRYDRDLTKDMLLDVFNGINWVDGFMRFLNTLIAVHEYVPYVYIEGTEEIYYNQQLRNLVDYLNDKFDLGLIFVELFEDLSVIVPRLDTGRDWKLILE